jgi:hypothetical protein
MMIIADAPDPEIATQLVRMAWLLTIAFVIYTLSKA